MLTDTLFGEAVAQSAGVSRRVALAPVGDCTGCLAWPLLEDPETGEVSVTVAGLAGDTRKLVKE